MRSLGIKDGRKKEIRDRMLRLRDDSKDIAWQAGTQEIERRAISHEWFLKASIVCCYVDFRGEVGTKGIIREAWRLGKKIFVPRVENAGMEFFRLSSFEELKAGAFGIPEPTKRPKEAVRICAEGNLMIMPGVAFDRKRNRIGYGGGYYDRYVSAHPKLHTMALAFEYQILPEVPHDPTDIRPDIIVTERRILGCSCRKIL